MAIVQISKIQQRSGNLVDLPQLDNAEFGWASDQQRLFIGRTGSTVSDENVEVLTSYSNISFSQIVGSDGGNFNIDAATNGQVLTYVASTNTWENYPSAAVLANASFKLNLGNANSLSISGGSIGYVLETDGYGNLSWTSKGTLRANISGLSNATPIIMTVANTIAYQNGTSITISGVNGVANSNVNSTTFYVKLASNFPTSGNVELYTSPDLVIGNAAVGTSLTYTNSPNAIATTALGGSGSAVAAGSNNQIQFNNSGLFGASANLTFDGNTMVVTGIANVSSNVNVAGNINLTRQLISTQATGTAPFSVASTTRVSNLNVAYANVADHINTALVTTGTYYPILANATSGNVADGANANLSFNAATGNLSTTLLNVTSNANVGNLGTTTAIITTGNITTINSGLLQNGNSNVTITANANISHFVTGNATAQLTITATGTNTAGYANVVGNANVGNLGTGGLIVATGNVTGGNLVTSGALSVTGNANTGNLGTTTAIITTGNITTINSGLIQNGNSNITITANGNISLSATGTPNEIVITATGINVAGTLNANGNSNVGNLGTGGLIVATGNVTGGNLTTGGVLSVTGNSNVGNLGTAGLIVATGNVTGGNLVTGGVLSVTGNSNVGNLGTGGLITATGNITGGNLVTGGVLSVTGNSNVGNLGTGGLITATGNITGGNLTTAGILVSSIATGTAPLTITSTTRVANLNVNYANVADFMNVNLVSTGTFYPVLSNATFGNVAESANANLSFNAANGALSATTFVGALSGAATSATTAGTVTTAAQPNITSVSTSFTSLTFANAQTISGNNMTLTTGANTNTGTITGNWSLSTGSRLQATYADLAEYYEADDVYSPGTVLAFGGEKEVTIAEDGTTRVAGVVSTNPAYAMNANCQGIAVAIALQGRVPTKVRGSVRKGDMMVSAGNGYARPWNNPQMGTVIGKSLENFDGVEGVIEVAVGRL